jgi:hypothetical protein
MKNIPVIRTCPCTRCGQCCGKDGAECWPKEWPSALKRFNKDELIERFPVISLIGLPRDTGVTEGIVKVDDKEFAYEWLEDGGLVAPGTETQCPFLEEAKLKGGSLSCGLHSTSEHWRWEKQCAPWPPETMMADKAKEFAEANPLCSYVWRPVDV